MYGQSCREVGRAGGGSPAVRGGLPLLGAQRDLPQPLGRGDPPGPLGPLGKAIHRPTKDLIAAADGEQRVQGLAFPRAPEVEVVWLIHPGVRVEAWAVWGGGRSRRGGGSRCRAPPSGQLVCGSGCRRGCSADCT